MTSPVASAHLAPVARRRARCARSPRTTAVPLVERRSRRTYRSPPRRCARARPRRARRAGRRRCRLGAPDADDVRRRLVARAAREPVGDLEADHRPRGYRVAPDGSLRRATRSRQATWATVLSVAMSVLVAAPSCRPRRSCRARRPRRCRPAARARRSPRPARCARRCSCTLSTCFERAPRASRPRCALP